jgi:hypothetical protein
MVVLCGLAHVRVLFCLWICIHVQGHLSVDKAREAVLSVIYGFEEVRETRESVGYSLCKLGSKRQGKIRKTPMTRRGSGYCSRFNLRRVFTEE